jgi:hypothetical protein
MITLSLISTLYKSLHTKSSPACSVFTIRCLVRDLNNGDSSASVLTSLLSSEYPTTEVSTEISHHLFSASLAKLNSQLTVTPTVFLITPLHEASIKHRFQRNSIVACTFVAAGTCLPIRCLETAVVYSPILQSLHSNGCTGYNQHTVDELVYITLCGHMKHTWGCVHYPQQSPMGTG